MPFSLFRRKLLALLGLVAWLIQARTAQAQSQAQWQWTAQVSGPDWALPLCLTTDRQGNVYVAGYFMGTTYFGSTALTSLPLPPGSLAMRSSGDAFVAKYSASGRLRWVRVGAGRADDQINALAVDTDGSVYVAGTFGESGTIAHYGATFGPLTLTNRSEGEMFLVKYDSLGREQWARQSDSGAGGSIGGYAEGRGVALDAHHHVYWCGNYNGRPTIAGEPVAQDGIFSPTLARLGPDGTLHWLRSGMCDMPAGSQSVRVAVDPAGRVYLAGTMGEKATFGNTTFTTLGTPDPQSNKNSDVFLAQYDSLGAAQWARQLGGTQADQLLDLAARPTGGVQVLTYFQGTASFGGTALTDRGGGDLAVASFTSGGTLAWVRQEGGSGPDGGRYANLAVDRQGATYAWGLFADLPTPDGPSVPGTGNFEHVFRYTPGGTRTTVLTHAPAPVNSADNIGLAALASQRPGTLLLAGTWRGTASYAGLPPITAYQPAATTYPYQASAWLSQLAFAPAEPSAETLRLPNIITPNGDLLNECFVVEGLDASACALTIYSRWGRQVYHTSSYQQDWSAAGLPAGLYYYLLQPPGQLPYKGWVEVVR